MSDGKVEAGIVGAKFAGSLHAESYKRCESVEVKAVSDVNKEALSSFQEEFNVGSVYTDYKKMFEEEDLDMVSVCVPNFLHKEISVAAAEAGLNIVCEKPLATSIEDAEEMVNYASENNVELMYAEDWIFAPALVRAVEIYENGGIGKLLYLRGKESHSGSHSKYAKKIKYCGGGSIIHLGVHPLGFSLSLFDEDKINSIRGVKTKGLENNLLQKDFEGEDWGLAVLKFKDDKIAQIESNYITYGGIDDVVEFYGTEGVIKVDLTQGSPLKVFSREGVDYTIEKAELKKGWSFPAVDEFRSLGYQDEIEHFVRHVQGKEELQKGVSAEAGLKVRELIHSIYKSAEEGKPVIMEE